MWTSGKYNKNTLVHKYRPELLSIEIRVETPFGVVIGIQGLQLTRILLPFTIPNMCFQHDGADI